jgi:hypothetical protein
MESGRYDTWSRESLEAALAQAEQDIRGLESDLEGVTDERDQYLAESRESAAQLGGIARILRGDGDPVVTGRELKAGRKAVQVQQVHRYAGTPDGIMELCSCGAQWLLQAGRCVVGGTKL